MNTGCPWGALFSVSQWLWQDAAECRAGPQGEQDRLVAVLRSLKESGVLEPGLLLTISSLPTHTPESPRFFSEYDDLLFSPLSQSSVLALSLVDRWEPALCPGMALVVRTQRLFFFSIFLFVCC